MADKNDKRPESVPGKFYVDSQCIDCDLCRETAPKSFTRQDDGGYSYVFAQPPRRIAKLEATIHMPAGIAEDLRERLIRAAHACPVKQSLHPDVEIVLHWRW